MRLLGAGFLWISLIYLGATYSTKLKRRIILIEKTIMMFEEFKVQLGFLNLPVFEMLCATGQKEYLKELDYIDICCNELKDGKDFPDAWYFSVNSTLQPYKREEKERLLQLGENLGISGTENQISYLNLQIKSFQDIYENAKHQQISYGNMITLLSAMAGCIIFILVI